MLKVIQLLNVIAGVEIPEVLTPESVLLMATLFCVRKYNQISEN